MDQGPATPCVPFPLDGVHSRQASELLQHHKGHNGVRADAKPLRPEALVEAPDALGAVCLHGAVPAVLVAGFQGYVDATA